MCACVCLHNIVTVQEARYIIIVVTVTVGFSVYVAIQCYVLLFLTFEVISGDLYGCF